VIETRLTNPPRVSLVIPTWNGRELLENVVLPSLVRQTYRDFAVIIVDNNSTDSSCEYLSTEWPAVTILRLQKNAGFAAAVNRGIGASKSELVALVNNDLELEPHWLEELVAALDANSSAGSVTGKMYDFENRQMINAAGVTGMWSGRFGGRGEGELDRGQYDMTEEIFGPTAGGAVYRRSAFEAVGTFDEEYFAYVEDIDWNFRAQYAGWKCLYVPSARSYHIGGATSSKVAGLRTFFLIRNTVWLVVSDFPASRIFKATPKLASHLILRSFSAMRSGIVWPVISAWLQAAIGIPRALRKRRDIQSGRKVSTAYLDTLLTPRHQASSTWPGSKAGPNRRS
jgi:GT2 family glycosyltransferase